MCDMANSIKCLCFSVWDFLCLSSSVILSRVEKEGDEGNWDDRERQRENVSIFYFLGGMQTNRMVENELRVLPLDRQAAGSE